MRNRWSSPGLHSGNRQTRSGQLPHRSRRRRSTACAARSAVPVAPGFVVAIIQITLLRPELARSHTEGFLASLPKLFPSAIETPLLCVCLLLQYQLQSCSREGEGDIGAHVL